MTPNAGRLCRIRKTATAATHPIGAQTLYATMSSAQTANFVNINWFSIATGTRMHRWRIS